MLHQQENLHGAGEGRRTRAFPKQKSHSARNKHASAERDRRKRINNHLDVLRKFFPHLQKRDKPRVLTEAVKYLRELREKVADRLPENGSTYEGSSFLPGGNDELIVSSFRQGVVKAVICCEDRPGLNGDLSEAVKSIEGKVVGAEMATVGGRTKAALVVQWDGGGGGAMTMAEEGVGLLRRALKAVVDKGGLDCSSVLGSPSG